MTWNAKGLVWTVGAVLTAPGCVIVMVDGPPGWSDNDDDGDGLWSDDERQCGTDPNADDTDDNGVLDSEEDADGDGYTNLDEVEAGSACADATSTPDSGLDDDDDEAQ